MGKRKYLRSIAKAKMTKMGFKKMNKHKGDDMKNCKSAFATHWKEFV